MKQNTVCVRLINAALKVLLHLKNSFQPGPFNNSNLTVPSIARG